MSGPPGGGLGSGWGWAGVAGGAPGCRGAPDAPGHSAVPSLALHRLLPARGFLLSARPGRRHPLPASHGRKGGSKRVPVGPWLPVGGGRPPALATAILSPYHCAGPAPEGEAALGPSSQPRRAFRPSFSVTSSASLTPGAFRQGSRCAGFLGKDASEAVTQHTRPRGTS